MAIKKTQNPKPTETATANQSAAAADNPPNYYAPRNIKYIGQVITDRTTGKVIKADAPLERINGAYKIVLPPAAEQIEKRFFWHEKAGEIVALFPLLYKAVKPTKKQ